VADFKPIQISDRVFHFVVASKNVGFHIYNLRSFACEQYHIFFNLWGNRGATGFRNSESIWWKKMISGLWFTVRNSRLINPSEMLLKVLRFCLVQIMFRWAG
jgi:hypothetical protein